MYNTYNDDVQIHAFIEISTLEIQKNLLFMMVYSETIGIFNSH